MDHQPEENAIGVGLYAGPCRHCGKWVNFKPNIAVVQATFSGMVEGKTYLVKKMAPGTDDEGVITYLLEEVEEPCTGTGV